jgi:hypothetical protein
VAAAVATGAIPGADGTITAWYDKNGKLRVIDEAATCSKGETPLNWNQAGPAGPKGDPGDPAAFPRTYRTSDDPLTVQPNASVSALIDCTGSDVALSGGFEASSRIHISENKPGADPGWWIVTGLNLTDSPGTFTPYVKCLDLNGDHPF